jgi:hypothetical protein
MLGESALQGIDEVHGGPAIVEALQWNTMSDWMYH